MSTQAFESPSGRISSIRPRAIVFVPVVVALTALVVLLLAAPASAKPRLSAADCPDRQIEPTAETIPQAEQATLCLLNVVRSERSLRPFKLSSKLSRAARTHSKNMVTDGRFDHELPGRPKFLSRIKNTGYLTGARNWSAGENIAWGTGDFATPSSLVKAWMNSAGHRKNILNPSFRDIGVGFAAGAPIRGEDGEGATATTDFGKAIR